MIGILLRHVVVTGRDKPPAQINFSPGLNVVWGAANTGKSHVLALIDFALGASSPPESPPEQIGYEGVVLAMEASDGRAWTLFRSLQGGDILKVEGLQTEWPDEGVAEVLSANHRNANSLSKFLLSVLGMSGVKLRRNARGETKDLSFRNLAHLMFISEGKIQSETSPIETGQYISRTAEFSLCKYLLTGTDDSLIQAIKDQKPDTARRAAKLELLDQQIAEAEQAVRSIDEDASEVDERSQRLRATMQAELRRWEDASSSYRALTSERRSLRRSRNVLSDRVDEIDLLLERFSLLNRHYTSDLERLSAIVEAASVFGALEDGPCPWVRR
jgi:flagellar biosynthesis/type III secretory pathway chaperone